MENAVPRITSEKIEKYISEFFSMQKGVLIKNPKEIIWFTENARITRQSLKHIVENRILFDRLNRQQLTFFILKARETVENPELNMDNAGNEKYPNSRLLGRFDPETNKGIMVVVHNTPYGVKDVITIFRKEARNYFRMAEK